MNIKKRLVGTVVTLGLSLGSSTSYAIDAASTAKALRIANTITGGFMPTSDPLFQQIVSKVAAGDLQGAALIAANSPYFANYMARRLALQMQSPALDANAAIDNDSTAFIIAHFTGAGGVKPSISTLFSENSTYLVNLPGAAAPIHAASLTAAQLATIDWSSTLVAQAGQNAADAAAAAPAKGAAVAMIPIPPQHVGGFVTLSDRINDQSFAMYGATAGTNLRMIEGIWEIATGLSLTDVSSDAAPASVAPRFVPEYSPNFFHGVGQPACITCHGGGMSSLNHGYSAVADVFDFDPVKGFSFITTPTTATKKSLGSDPKKRTANSTCNLVATPTAVCNPDSIGADVSFGWDVGATWSSTGVLQTMGWKGPTTGQGLNALGQAIGKANILYEFLTKRVINEVCPMGTFSANDVSSIAAQANPNASPAGTDDIRTIVAAVAANASCL